MTDRPAYFDAPARPDRRPAAVILAAHIHSLNDWIFASYFTPGEYNIETKARDDLLNAGHLEPGERDGHATYELTDLGRTWLAEQES